MSGAYIDIEKLWDQKYRDAAVPFPIGGVDLGTPIVGSVDQGAVVWHAGSATWVNEQINDGHIASPGLSFSSVNGLAAALAIVNGDQLVNRRRGASAYTVPAFLATNSTTITAGTIYYATGFCEASGGATYTKARVYVGTAFTSTSEFHISISDGAVTLADSGDVHTALNAAGAGTFTATLGSSLVMTLGQQWWAVIAGVGQATGSLKSVVSTSEALLPTGGGSQLAGTTTGYLSGVPSPTVGSTKTSSYVSVELLA